MRGKEDVDNKRTEDRTRGYQSTPQASQPIVQFCRSRYEIIIFKLQKRTKDHSVSIKLY